MQMSTKPPPPTAPGTHRPWALLLGALLAVISTACGGYADTSVAFRKALTTGRPENALAAVNEALEVEKAEDLPKDVEAQTPLLLLERGTILQALGRYELSSRDFQYADNKLDVLDLTSDTLGSISKYLFSDDATLYKSPPHEKLLINTVNMINYLARGDASGAKVEARRLVVNQKFLRDTENQEASMLGLSSYLAGCAYEAAGEGGEAMRHYADAKAAGGVATLDQAIRRLSARTGASDSRLAAALEGANEEYPDARDTGELVVVVQTGMAPYKFPERLPIGAAVVAASSPGPGARLSNGDRRRANAFAAKGLLKWVNFASLRKVNTGRVGSEQVVIDGRAAGVGPALDVDAAVLKEFEKVKATMLVAAISRLLTRAVAGEVADAASRKGSKSGLAGMLIGLAVEGALTAADTPDTRSWVTLPGRFDLSRVQLPPGEHTVQVTLSGRQQTAQVTVKAGGLSLVNFSAFR